MGNKHLLIVLLCFVISSQLYFYIRFQFPCSWKQKYSEIKNSVNSTILSTATKDNITILLWTTYFGISADNTKALGGLVGYNSGRCQSWCQLVGNRNLLNVSDAVVWHGWPGDLNLLDLPKLRNPKQTWIWWSRESPYYTLLNLKHVSIFNWTMTYREDSDIVFNYGWTEKLDAKFQQNISVLQNKSKLAVAVISNCKSFGKREELIKLLELKGLPVDVYGKCGTTIEETEAEFWSRLSREYKFYLAFENALCVDYVTEKFWRTLGLGMVPVVYGNANYSKIAPPNSYINVRDFDSSTELIQRLLYLDLYPDEYEKYFEWQKSYKIFQGGNGLCSLCQKLRDGYSSDYNLKNFNNSEYIKVDEKGQHYKDLYEWWGNSVEPGVSACSSPEEEWFWYELNQL